MGTALGGLMYASNDVDLMKFDECLIVVLWLIEKLLSSLNEKVFRSFNVPPFSMQDFS